MTGAMVVLQDSQAEPGKSSNIDNKVVRQDLSPMHGILSMFGRKKAESWSCLVCGTSQPPINIACSTCNRDRFPPWLLDVHGCVVLPGSIVRCPRAFVRFHPPPPPPTGLSIDQPGGTTPPRQKGRPLTPPASRPGSSSPRATTPPLSPDRTLGTLGRTRATTKPTPSPSPPGGRSSRRALGADQTDGTVSPATGVSPRSRGSKAAVPQQSPKANKAGTGSRTSVSGGGVLVSTPRRRAKGRAEADFEAATVAMKSKFEGQPGECVVMVVVVNGVRPQPPRAPRSLEGYCIMEGDDGEETSRVLVKVILDMTEATPVEVVDPSLTKEEREKFLQFGLCGRCERTYRIGQGWKHVSLKKTVAGWEEKARNLSRLAAETEERKRALIAGRGSRADILKANRRLKSIREEIAATRRFLEPLVMSCPFCLWNCSPLFSADDAEAEEHDLANLGPSSPRAACYSSSPETVAGDAESVVDTYVNPLAAVMGSLPLKEAFGEYCQKEYCSESFKFLVDASEFQGSVHAAQSSGEEGKESYEEFIAIVNEYIKDNSNGEINIDSRTKKQILAVEERSSYAYLDVEGRSRVFLQAQKEIAKMLADNLLIKFKATAEYKRAAGKLLLEAS